MVELGPGRTRSVINKICLPTKTDGRERDEEKIKASEIIPGSFYKKAAEPSACEHPAEHDTDGQRDGNVVHDLRILLSHAPLPIFRLANAIPAASQSQEKRPDLV